MIQHIEQREPLMQWMVRDGNGYQICGRTVKKLPPGAFSCQADCYGNPLFQARQLHVDDLIDFPDSLPARVLEEIDRFWKMGDRFRRHGFLHRRGYLMHGKQGCGKSSLVHLIIDRIVRNGHLAFFCDHPYHFVTCMEQLRNVEPERPIVCVFEDIDALIKHHGDSILLQWLDGNHQVDKAINIATTNYPETLDRRIVSRPRRFDRILRIDAPDAKLREAYFARKLPEQTPAERGRWVELSDGLPFAALAELIISVCCLENDLEKSVAILRQMDEHQPTSEEEGQEPTDGNPLESYSLTDGIPF